MIKSWLALGLSGIAAISAIAALVVAGRLEEEVQGLRAGPAQAAVRTPHPDSRQVPSGNGTVEPTRLPDDSSSAALRDIEKRLSALEGKPPPTERPPDEVGADAAALQAIVVDRTQTGTARVEALKRLRRMRPDGRTPEVAKSMLDLLQTSPDAEIRADICRNLSRVILPELGLALMTRLRADDDESTREEAAESLESYLDDMGVVAALEFARLNDPSELVRNQAAKTLAKKGNR